MAWRRGRNFIAENFAREAPSPPVSAPMGIAFDPAGPGRSAQVGVDHFVARRYAPAFTAFVASVDKLHDFYVFERCINRQPGEPDLVILDGLVASLRELKGEHPSHDVSAEVREVTHRLRTISTTLDELDRDSTWYRNALNALAQQAPEVDVSDIYWS